VKQFENICRGNKVPETLKKLALFEHTYQNYYAFMFSLNDNPEESMLEDLFDNEYVSSRFVEFAFADENGAMFALWIKEEGMELEEAPVVYISEDCVINILALNLKDFLVMLSFDVDCGGDFYYKDGDDYEQSPYHEAYCLWLKQEMHIEPIKTYEEGDEELNPVIEGLIEQAVQEHKLAFDTWMVAVDSILEVGAASNEELVNNIKNINLNPLEEEMTLDMTTLNLPLSMDDFIAFLDVPMDNKELLKSIMSLGFKRPLLNASYIRETRIEDRNEEDTLWFYIEDRDSVVSFDVVPQLSSFHNAGSTMAYPFGILTTDSYADVVNKLPLDAVETSDEDESKQWRLKRNDGLEYELHVGFEDDGCDSVDQVSIFRLQEEND